MAPLVGTPSDQLPDVLATGATDVRFAFISMSAREPGGRDAEYLEWHSLDHRPEQHRLAGLRQSLRIVSTPACRAARAASVTEYDAADHVMTYLFNDAEALPGFNDLGAALAAGGRMPLRLPTVAFMTANLAGTMATPSAVAGADVIPWRPAHGVYLMIERGEAPGRHPHGGSGRRRRLVVPGRAGPGAVFDRCPRAAGHLLLPGRRPRRDGGAARRDDATALGVRRRRRAPRRPVPHARTVRVDPPPSDDAGMSTATFQLSVGSPIVTRSGTRWADEGGIEELARIAETADRLGYHHLTCSEHIALPEAELERRGSRYWDPLATFGFLAARTERIRFTTYVLVLPYHHPLEIAKRYGTLDAVSNGRVILGVGVGTLKEEFDLVGAPLDDRGPRSDDAIKALRASLSQREPEYHGEYYDFEGLVVDPCAVQEHVPIWVGGRTLRSLRRAATLTDGWCPFAVPPGQAAEWLAKVDVPPGFEVVLPPTERLDPLNEPAKTQEVLAQTVALGATIVISGFASESLQHYLDQLEALATARAGM